jgi:hypothetical protein
MIAQPHMRQRNTVQSKLFTLRSDLPVAAVAMRGLASVTLLCHQEPTSRPRPTGANAEKTRNANAELRLQTTWYLPILTIRRLLAL